MGIHLSEGKKWVMFVSVAIVGTALDIGTKYAAANALIPGVPVSILGEYVQLMLLFNRNAIFGIDPRIWFPSLPLNLIYYIFSTVAIILLVLYFRAVRSGWPTCWGIALIMPGALGNLYDRIVHSGRGVADFIKLGISMEIYWPIFNLADSYITIGVLLILFELMREEFQRRKQTHVQKA